MLDRASHWLISTQVKTLDVPALVADGARAFRPASQASKGNSARKRGSTSPSPRQAGSSLRPSSNAASARRFASPVWKSNIQADFNVRVIERFDTNTSAVLRELDESSRSVQKSAESTSI